MEAAAATAPRRSAPRGLALGWAVAAVAFLVASLLVGIARRPGRPRRVDDPPVAGAHAPRPWTSLARSTPTEESILWQLRVPRVVLAALVGGMLALAGATYQGVFRNPLADPYLLGVAAGAGLGATLAIAYLPRAARAASCSRSPRSSAGSSRSSLAYARRPLRRTRARRGDARPRGCDGRVVLHRAADVRPAAEHRHAAGGLLLDPRRLPDVGLARCRRSFSRTCVDRLGDHPRASPRARRAQPSATTRPRASGSNVAACGCSSSSRRRSARPPRSR